MSPLDLLSQYLSAMERRVRLLALSRGSAVTAIAALFLTVAAVEWANAFAFSNGAVLVARLALFLGLACAIAAALIVPLVRLNRRHAARAAEKVHPEFEQRLVTLSERAGSPDADPFLELLAADTLQVAERAAPATVAKTTWIAGFASAAAVAMLLLIWLGMAGPGFLGYGTALLWAGPPKGEMKPFYSILVEPGNRTIRKRADQIIQATLLGFTAPRVRFFAKYSSAPQWEQAEMRTETGGSAYQFLIAGVPESLDYYVEAGGVRSPSYHLSAIDLPSIKNLSVTYHYPAWTGMKDYVEDPGGDLRAVQGTIAEVALHLDRPLANGALLLDDGGKVVLRGGGANTLIASVPIQKDGMYHIAAIENGEDVRLSEDYFIEAQKDNPPQITITRPGHDFKASPIEEVTVEVSASDDFGLRGVDLHYSVNGGPEKTVSLLDAKGAKTAIGSTVIALEDFKVEPGDIVSLYAAARGARQTTNTDMFFIEAQPFERNYTQSQSLGGNGAPGDPGERQNQLSERQKEIITATWNQIKGNGAKASDAENAAFLASVESKLRDQANSLADRMKARQMEEAGESFKSFVTDMEQAAGAMGPAAGKLRSAKWQDALAPEQKALQFLLRAEAVFRDIQVAFGQSGSGGGGISGATRDMQGLFDLELDTEKNQYEGVRQTQSADARQRQLEDALQKLEQLAKRQQELAEQQRRATPTPQQRWEQELLRREAEQLQQQMQQLAQNAPLSRDGQPGQQGQSGQAAASGQTGSPSQQGQPGRNSQGQVGQAQANQRLNNADSRQLSQTIDRLQQALQDMRQAGSSQQAGTPQGEAEARRAADRLREAQQMLAGLRSAQSSGQVGDMARQADDLARRQQEFEGQMRRAFGPLALGVNRDQAEQLAQQKESELADLKRLQQQMQDATRDLMGTQRQAATKLREALSEVEQQEVAREMERNAGWIHRGQGEAAALSEAQATAGLNRLRDQLHEVEQALGKGDQPGPGQDDKNVAQTLSQVEQLRRQMEQLQSQLASRGRPQARTQQSGQPGTQGQPGQPGGSPQGAPDSESGSPSINNGRAADGAGAIRDPKALWQPGGGMESPVRPEDIENSYRGALESLGRLEQQLRDDPATARDIQSLVHDLRNFDPRHFTDDPLLSQRIQAALAGAEQVEMELRRMVDALDGAGSVRSPAGERVPQGYQDAVADYFRKLSKTK
ncbi:MAG TPA: hypothetical protein VGF03_22205 [Bryobacteraceae bacterium]